MVVKTKSLILTAVAALVMATLLFLITMNLNQRTNVHTDEAIASNIDMAIEVSPVVVLGKVIDNGKPRNLRRDINDTSKEDLNVIVPGTEYTIEVSEVLKGEIPAGTIKVAVGGGTYKDEAAPLRASVNENEEYLFTLAPSGESNYYGLIEPFIYQIKNNQVEAVSNIQEYKEAFKESKMSKEKLISNIKEANQ